MDHKSLTLGDALKLLREDVQAENTLITARISWYVTTQAFMLAAYVASWAGGFQHQDFIRWTIPPLGGVISLGILSSVWAATWAQSILFDRQSELIESIRSEFPDLSREEVIALRSYEMAMVGKRSRPGRGAGAGFRIHWMGRVPALLIPIAFAAFWLLAYWFTRRL